MKNTKLASLFLLLALVLAACGPTPTPVPTVTSTASPVPTDTLTPTLTPTATPLPSTETVLMLNGFVRDESLDSTCSAPCRGYSNPNFKNVQAFTYSDGSFTINIFNEKAEIAVVKTVISGLYSDKMFEDMGPFINDPSTHLGRNNGSTDGSEWTVFPFAILNSDLTIKSILIGINVTTPRLGIGPTETDVPTATFESSDPRNILIENEFTIDKDPKDNACTDKCYVYKNEGNNIVAIIFAKDLKSITFNIMETGYDFLPGQDQLLRSVITSLYSKDLSDHVVKDIEIRTSGGINANNTYYNGSFGGFLWNFGALSGSGQYTSLISVSINPQ